MTDSFGLPWTGRVAGRWGHWAPQMLIATIGAVIVMGLRPIPPSALATLTPVALLTFVVVTWLLMRKHDRRLCERCAAAMPLNPSELATRYRRRLWLAHAGGNRWLAIPYLVVLLGSNLLAVSGGRVLWAVIQASMIYLILSHATHRRLQPWCPWCDRGGDDHETPAMPDPVPGGRGRLV